MLRTHVHRFDSYADVETHALWYWGILVVWHLLFRRFSQLGTWYGKLFTSFHPFSPIFTHLPMYTHFCHFWIFVHPPPCTRNALA